MFTRIRYMSQPTHSMSKSEVQDIVQKAQASNARLGVSGFMFAAPELFFQVLEGPSEKVGALYDKIRRDPRHRNVMTLIRDDGVQRLQFPDWSMQFIESSEAIVTALKEASQARQKLDSMLQAVERQVFQISSRPAR